MPARVEGAVPVATFPVTLSTKFSPSRSVQGRSNEYRDGSSQRDVLVLQSRRNWQLSKRLTITELDTLRTFWHNNANTAFYFYDPYETSPTFTKVPSGTSGRYIVRFASDWQETIGMVRSDVSVELIEVTGTPLDGPATPIVPARGGIASAQLSITTKRTLNGAFGSGISTIWEFAYASANQSPIRADLPIGGGLNGGITWDVRTDTFNLPTNTGVSYSGTLTVRIGFYVVSVQSLIQAVDQLYVYDVTLDVSYGDGTASTLKPVISQDGGNSTFAYIQNPSFAADASSGTYALIYADWTTYPHAYAPTLVCSFY